MRALTICQPWATLMFAGVKLFETRSWAPHRDCLDKPFAIHAGKKPIKVKDLPRALDALCVEQLGALYATTVPFGQVLGIATLLAFKPTAEFVDQISARERLVGDWSAGRFAWCFQWEEQFEEPIPARGLQKIWNWEHG